MNKVAFVGVASLMVGCMVVNARAAHTGHLIVSLTDRETGGPITNATVAEGEEKIDIWTCDNGVVYCYCRS